MRRCSPSVYDVDEGGNMIDKLKLKTLIIIWIISIPISISLFNDDAGIFKDSQIANVVEYFQKLFVILLQVMFACLVYMKTKENKAK